jgi:hypothetical protein
MSACFRWVLNITAALDKFKEQQEVGKPRGSCTVDSLYLSTLASMLKLLKASL